MRWATDTRRSGKPLLLVTLKIAAVAVITSVTLTACSSGSPDNVTETLNKALTAHVEGRFEDATKNYREVLRMDPTNKYAEYNLGVIAHQKGRLVEAENHYRLTLGKDSQYVPAMYNLAIVRERAGDDDGAMALYRTLIQIAPNHEGTRVNLGLLLRKQGLDDAAQEQLELAARLRTASPAPTGG